MTTVIVGMAVMVLVAGSYLMGAGYTWSGLSVAGLSAGALGLIVAALQQRFTTLVGKTRDGEITVQDFATYMVTRVTEIGGDLNEETIGKVQLFVNTPTDILPVQKLYTARLGGKTVLFLDATVEEVVDGQDAN